MNILSKRLTPVVFTLLAVVAYADESDEILITDDDSAETLIIEDNSPEESLIEINESDEAVDQSVATEESASEEPAPSSSLSFNVDEVWIEYGHFPQDRSAADDQGYVFGKAALKWSGSNQWELHASARVDGYGESGDSSWGDASIDYDETFIRYKSDRSVLTLGAQKVIWGRIDEFPPTDRLSTQDFRRFLIDDLEDRRLASPLVRIEQFFKSGKIDFVFLPVFREAELPDHESVWYPINRRTGEILGFETTPAMANLVKNTPVRERAPNSEGGAGLRFSSLGSTIDYALTLQKGRPTTPYFRYNPAQNVIETVYPRTWVVSGDLGFEGLGGTVKFEASWLSDTPVTKTDGSFTTVESVSWGSALEIFPGDGDARLNLQLVGQKLLDAPPVLDRTEVYAFNGSYEVPFADNRWRFKTRFYIELNDKDNYINPEIAYTGIDSQDIYLELHFIDGDEGTLGGFYEDNSLATLGWRASF